jgi:hypothetical protein
MNRDSTRRRFLRLGGAMLTVGVTAGAAGCTGDSGDGGNGNGNGNGGNGNGNGDNGGGGESTLDVVPSGATSVTYADVGGMIEDDTVGELLNEVLDAGSQTTPAGEDIPESKDEVLEEFENESGLDPTEMGETVGFGKTPDVTETPTPGMPGGPTGPLSQYGATWFTAGWSEDDLVSAIEENEEGVELVAGEYNGYTTYEAPSETDTGMTETPAFGGQQPAEPSEVGMMGVIEDGEYVIGTEEAVTDALDVAAGDMDAVGEDLRNAYTSVPDGLAKAASSAPELPDDSVPQRTVGEDGPALDQDRLEELQTGAMVVDTSDGELSMEASMRAGTEEAAGHVVEVLDGAIASTKKNIEDEELASKLDDISIDRDGQNVSVAYSNDVEGLKQIIDMIEEMYGGMGMTPVGSPGSLSSGGISLPP